MSDIFKPLPTGEYGDTDCSARFGTSIAVIIEYNSDFDGTRVPFDVEDRPKTIHGPFFTEEEAKRWIEDYPDSKDVYDMYSITINNVR